MAAIHTPGVGAQASGIAKIAGSVGKPGRQQPARGRFMATALPITGGDPIAHSMNHYGKTPPSVLSGMPGTTGVDPTQHPGVSQIRDGGGGIKKNARSGGLGPGPMSAPGGDDNYSATGKDSE